MIAVYIALVFLGILFVTVSPSLLNRAVPWFGRLNRLRQRYDAIDNPTWRVAIEDRRFVVTSANVHYTYPEGTGAWLETAALKEAIRRHSDGHISALTRYQSRLQVDSEIVSERKRVETLEMEETLRLERAEREFEKELLGRSKS